MSLPIRNITGILPGDLIRLTQNERTIVGRVDEQYSLQLGHHTLRINNLFAAGFVAELLDRLTQKPAESPYVWASYVNQDGTIHPGARIIKYREDEWRDATGNPLSAWDQIDRDWRAGKLVPLTVAPEHRPEPATITFD